VTATTALGATITLLLLAAPQCWQCQLLLIVDVVITIIIATI